MKLDVSNVPESGMAVSVTIGADEVNMTEGMPDLAGALHLQGRVIKAGEEMVLHGTLRGAFNLTCSRCLKELARPFEIEVSATYVQPSAEGLEVRTKGDDAEEPPLLFFGDEIDLVSGIREDLLLNVPLKPLCHDDCRGLCPQCGTDLNEGECGCNRTTIDQRLSVLREIRTQLEKRQENHST